MRLSECMRRADYHRFFEKYLRQQHSEAEHRAFLAWFASLDEKQADEVMRDYQNLSAEYAPEKMSPADRFLASKIEGRLDEWDLLQERENRKIGLAWVLPRVAAAAVLVWGLYFTYDRFYRAPAPVQAAQSAVATDVAPGDNKALLTLSDGASIVLSDAGNGEIAKQSLVQIKKSGDGQLVYDPMENYKVSAQNLRKEYNTVATPRSGQYQVLLPDGTKVRLNSMSSLRFPVTFDPVERKVELSGEAYFEVARVMVSGRRIPFKVISNGQAIEVTGTKFNVNTFSDDSYIKTTLLEGGVNVKEQTTGNSVQLKPGEQSLVRNSPGKDAGGKAGSGKGKKDVISVRKADIEGDLAWTNGFFHFRDTELKEVMQQLIRWYDIEVEYVGSTSGERFNGYVSRNKSLSNVLAILQHSGEVRFEMVGNAKVKVIAASALASP